MDKTISSARVHRTVLSCAGIHHLDGKLVCNEVATIISEFLFYLWIGWYVNLKYYGENRRIFWWEILKVGRDEHGHGDLAERLPHRHWVGSNNENLIEIVSDWFDAYCWCTGARCTLRSSRPPSSGWLSTKPLSYASPRFLTSVFLLLKIELTMSDIFSAWITASCHRDQVGHW